MYVIGTAGHVDHGKSSLVRALTGINPDRLREEQLREMTIDLGFAWLQLPSGREVSIVDVPGHEDFIKNMLAGIGGIDLALFVVAADEAVMPQTREHLAILDLLDVSRGVIALTKADLVDDPEWLDLVAEEVREELAHSSLRDAPLVAVSAHTGAGLPKLLATLDTVLDGTEPRPDLGRPRLPIDRAFTIAGFGTVVTGTLRDGSLQVGDELAIVPGDLVARVRGLQTHKHKVERAQPGSRVAVNLTGVSVTDLSRGQVLARPGALKSSTLLDARLRTVADLPWPLKHNVEVEFYTGAARVLAHVRLLDADVLEAGQTGWVQLRLDEPVAVLRGDRYIIRSASPSVTLGGGRIVETQPGRRHRRFRADVMQRLEALAAGTPEDVLQQALLRQGVIAAREAVKASGLPREQAETALAQLITEGAAVYLGDEVPPARLGVSATGVMARSTWERLAGELTGALADYHTRYPLRIGMAREEVGSRLGLAGAFVGPFLDRAASEGLAAQSGLIVRLARHTVQLNETQHAAAGRVLATLRANRTPPPLAQVEQELGSAELLQVLIDQGQLVKASDEVLFDAATWAEMRDQLVAHMRAQGEVTVAQARDLLGTSRKCALAFLEEMDRQRLTRRVGDVRVLR